MHVSIVGGGWAGLSAAVAACEAGHQVALYEAAQTLGGRARSLPQTFNDLPLDNGQHILIGAYSATLDMMQRVGLRPEILLHRLPLDLRFANQEGLALPNLPAPINALMGILFAKNWSPLDKWRLLKACVSWQRHQFNAPAHWHVADLVSHAQLPPKVVETLIEPLCLSALNTPLSRASARVFLRVLHDALLGPRGSSDLLIPKVDLQQLWPSACQTWLLKHGAKIHLGHRVTADNLSTDAFATSDQHCLILATPAWEAARLTATRNPSWSSLAQGLSHEAIATVYLQCNDAGFEGLPQPMMALHDPTKRMAQFVICRTRSMKQIGLLACVASACLSDRTTLESGVMRQLREQLGLEKLQVVKTVIEKRATFACTPDTHRPSAFVAQNVWACGDYIDGPYPATLEGAVRSGLQVVAQL